MSGSGEPPLKRPRSDRSVSVGEQPQQQQQQQQQREVCKYGSQCYRLNPDHLARFSHPASPVFPWGGPRSEASQEPRQQQQQQQQQPSVVDLTGTSTSEGIAEGNTADTRTRRTAEKFLYRLNTIKGISSAANAQCMRFRDIFRSLDDMEEAVVTTYLAEPAWIVREVPMLKNRLKWTLAYDKKQGQLDLNGVSSCCTLAPVDVKIPFGVHHTKMVFVFCKSRVRVAVCTANAILVDYERKTNAIWMQDFPRLGPDAGGQDQGELAADFLDVITTYTEMIGLSGESRALERFDYSAVRVVLIPSAPGRTSGVSREKFGHMKLRKYLRAEPAFEWSSSSEDWAADECFVAQFTSLGSLNEAWLNQMRASFAPHPVFGQKIPPLRLMWPTKEFVRNSIDGWSAGDSIPAPEKNHKPFLRPLMVEYSGGVPERNNVPPHIKTFARVRTDSAGQTHAAWVFITSHNLSQAAWGTLQKQDSELFIRHFEMGVLMLPSLCGQGRAFCTQNHPDEGGRLLTPLPYQLPLRPYTAADIPWSWNVPYMEPDLFGRPRLP